MKPSVALDINRQAVRDAVRRYERVTNPRVFGSIVRGTDRDGSDLDLLVDTLPGVTLFDLGGLQNDLEAILGVKVDLVTSAGLPRFFLDRVLYEAVTL
jgi:predicted nucleotidyltransferase